MLSIKDDWMIFDGLQTVSYYVRTDDDSFMSPFNAQALQREKAKDFESADDNIEIARFDCIWDIWENSMAIPASPKRGDKFIATGRTWIVEHVDYSPLPGKYRMHCYELI